MASQEKENNAFTVTYHKIFEDDLEKLDAQRAMLILMWIEKNLEDSSDPRLNGKPLKGEFKGLWRYRIGDYRILAEIIDKELTILCIRVAHRSKIYRTKGG